MSAEADRIDHLVLTVTDLDATIEWYRRVVGLEAIRSDAGRWALRVGDSKINLHHAASPVAPHAASPRPGSADICLTTRRPLDDVISGLVAEGVAIEVGPVRREGARSTLRSVYIRDPDGNLVEIANEVSE